MEPEDLDIEKITEDRRKAIEQNIHVISIEDLKSLGEKLHLLSRKGERHVVDAE